MTPRQRVQTALDRKRPDRVPCMASLAGADVTWLMQTFGLPDRDHAEQFMLSDFRRVYPAYIGPELTTSDTTGAQMTVWGITTKDGDYSLDGFPLVDADIQKINDYPYPTTDWYDFDAFAQPPATAADHMTICGEPFCILGKAYDLMGMEDVMMGMIEKPDIIHALLEQITQSRLAMIDKILTTAPWLDIIHIMDELGAQDSLLISPAQFREFIFPYHKRLIDLIHRHNRLAYYHSCGSVYDLIPDLIDMGIDILDNIQPTAAKMDPRKIKAEFGHQLVIQCQTDEIGLVANGTPDQIYRTYRQLIEDLAPTGGMFISPTFRSQTTPKENLLALLKAIEEPL